MIKNKTEDVDYSEHYMLTGQRPQNFIKNVEPNLRYQEFPKTKELINMKTQVINKRNHPSQYIQTDLSKFDLISIGTLFDVIIIDPPWEQYQKRVIDTPMYTKQPEKFKAWTVDQISNLKIPSITDDPCFLFLWVGSQHLEDGRQIFRRWGFKRCQDVCWIKTNKQKDPDQNKDLTAKFNNTLLKRVKEHCLVGLKGDVKKASDGKYIHANIDTDVIIDQQPSFGNTKKPQELYDIIERFCMGRRRLELFGQTHNIRKGWLTIGQSIIETNFNRQQYISWFEGQDKYPGRKDHKGGRFLGTTEQIQNIRPKSPPREGASSLLLTK